MQQFFIIVANVFQVIIFSVSIYQLIISFAGFKKKKIEHLEEHNPNKSFAILVAAHNEEKVISPLLENLNNLDYPKELYEVFVICDNCTDNTALIAKSHNVHAMERYDEINRGKGFAMEWMLEKLWRRERQFDAVVVFDADNLISRNFLIEMNNKLMDGHQVIQSYVDTKNPYDSWVSLSYAITYWFINRMWQQARHNWGMASTLSGTGMCFEMKLLKEMGWNATSLTEDVEFTARCIANDIYPTWANQAIVYDEKPISLISSIRQRIRWMRGHTDCARRYMKPLLIKAIQTRKFAQFDAAMYLFQPIRFLFIAAVWVMSYLQLATPLYTQFELLKMIPDWGWIVLNLALFLQFPLVMLVERRPWKAYLGLFLFPVFQFTWFPITLIGLFTSKNKTWNHTIHTRSIRIEDVSGS
ncbi:glycosyltransferase family 2 protein [Bacillus sp. 31A1R]|uniref:Glycosyltransferase family 2 protein n=1 Tax=Robertmurraya mangrovi TaxID=3098077 RepID=A0ABU5J2L8_9BACI|nr:glycosyltransferase family 2 protein [Bacillus sp. 31A1R]MDZ5473668.1 glycosyltransferase family 2 protein [Bacillus sp. 31A1R]